MRTRAHTWTVDSQTTTPTTSTQKKRRGQGATKNSPTSAEQTARRPTGGFATRLPIVNTAATMLRRHEDEHKDHQPQGARTRFDWHSLGLTPPQLRALRFLLVHTGALEQALDTVIVANELELNICYVEQALENPVSFEHRVNNMVSTIRGEALSIYQLGAVCFLLQSREDLALAIDNVAAQFEDANDAAAAS